jgi:hypothetical protein
MRYFDLKSAVAAKTPVPALAVTFHLTPAHQASDQGARAHLNLTRPTKS